MWTRPARALAPALVAVIVLGGCSDDSSDDRATDRTTDRESTGTPSDSPSASPTVGTYPEFEAEDYAYTLLVSCFCPDAGIPVRVTVRQGEVEEAVYAANSAGIDRGDPAPDFRALTINDVIGELNGATGAESVRVDWPDGQDYPSEVSIDQSARIADEEIGYTLTDVAVG